jgi:hypothetical protein
MISVHINLLITPLITDTQSKITGDLHLSLFSVSHRNNYCSKLFSVVRLWQVILKGTDIRDRKIRVEIAGIE